MTLRTRLLGGFGVVVLLLLVPNLFAVSRLTQLEHLAVERRSGQATAVASLGRVQAMISDIDRLERSLVATSDSALGAAASAAVDSLALAFGELRASAYGEEATGLGPLVDSVQALGREISDHVAAGRIDTATDALGEMIGTFAELEARTAAVARSIDELSRQELLRAERLSANARSRTIVVLLFALAVGGGVVVLTTRSLTNPLRRLRRAMARVADGTFEAPPNLPYGRTDEIGELSRSFQRMTDRLDQLNRTKAEFLGMASHELKTPLNVIAAYAELIESDLNDDVSDRHRDMINTVADQAEILARRVSRLMDISRLEAGTYELAPETVRVEDLVTGVRRLFERFCAAKGVELRVTYDACAMEDVVLDVDVVREDILGNLVANALRFTPEGGWISLEVERCEGGLDFVVTDSGEGIPEEHRPYIFDKHYTSDRTRAVGSGLGLAIVKEMVALHGGMVTLEDPPPGGGARFRVALPLTPGTAELEVPGYTSVASRSAAAAGESSLSPSPVRP